MEGIKEMDGMELIGNMSLPEKCAVEINTIKRSVARQCLDASVEIGRLLCEAKEAVPHGDWADWLEINVDYSQSTANNLMRLYREYGEQSQMDFFSENKMEIFGTLTPSQALALLSLPQSERREYVESRNMEEVSVRDMEAEIAAMRERAEKAEADKSAAEKEAEGAKATAKAAQALADSEKKKAGESGKSIRELKDKLASAKAEQERLEKQLSEAAERPVPEQIRIEVPRDLESEPEYIALKKELAMASPGIVKFKLEFERLQDSFAVCIGAVYDVAADDSEKGEKLKGALRRAISDMAEAVK